MFYRTLVSILFLFIPTTLLAVDIDGEVRLSGQHGLAKPATVQLVRAGQVAYERFTGLDGRFEFHNVEPTRYVIRAVYDGMPEIEVPLDALRGGVRFTVPPIVIKVPKEKVDKASTISVDQLLIPREAMKEYEKGTKDSKAGLCDRAIPHFQKAVELAPKYGEAFNDLGNCLKAQGNSSEAEAAYRKAVELNTTVYAPINLADLYALQKHYDQAQQVIETAIKKNGGEGDLYFALSRIHFEQGRLKEAETAGLEAHSRTHRTADVHLLLAKIYLAQNNQPAMISQLETYLKENPAGPVADQIRKTLKSLSH
jgi:tetratricopeptide (TPR) repeat protein